MRFWKVWRELYRLSKNH